MKNQNVYPTNIHRYEKPVYCFSILEGCQFYLNEKFSNNISYSQSNNNYQNLYLSYKKSTIIRKLTKLTEHLKYPCELTETSIPGLVITLDDCYIQLSIDRYEGYYNNLLFETYRRLHPAIDQLFDTIDLLHKDLFPFNQHQTTLTRVMIVHFLHSIGIPSLQETEHCGSRKHKIHTHPALCSVQKVEWSECPDCIKSKVPENLTFGILLNKYLSFYLNFNFFEERIVSSPLFYQSKQSTKFTNFIDVRPPFTPWVLASTGVTTFELQDMLFIYKSLQNSLTNPLCKTNLLVDESNELDNSKIINNQIETTLIESNENTMNSIQLTQLESDNIITSYDNSTTVMFYDLPEFFQMKTLIQSLNESEIQCEMLVINPSYTTSFSKESGVIFCKCETQEIACYLHYIVPLPYKRCYVHSNIFENRPNGSFYIDLKDTLILM